MKLRDFFLVLCTAARYYVQKKKKGALFEVSYKGNSKFMLVGAI